MKLSLTRQEQRSLAVVMLGGGLFLWVYYAYVVGPMLWGRAASLQGQIVLMRQEVTQLERVAQGEATLRAQLESLKASVTELRGVLPKEERLSSLIERLRSELAPEAGVKILTIFPQREPEARRHLSPAARQDLDEVLVYKSVGIQIEAIAGFHELGRFLSMVEAADEPIRLSMLRISSDVRGDRERHEVKIVLRSYFSVAEGATGGSRS